MGLIICAFRAHFNLYICCTVSERERVKGNWGRKLRPNCALFTRVNIRGGGQNVQVRVSRSAEDQTFGGGAATSDGSLRD